VESRLVEHKKRDLIKGNHHNVHLQRFVNKYGIDKLNFFCLKNVITVFLVCLMHRKIIKVSASSITKYIRKNTYTTKGWSIEVMNNNLYNENFCISNIDLFDDNCHPQPELISMLKSL